MVANNEESIDSCEYSKISCEIMGVLTRFGLEKCFTGVPIIPIPTSK